MTNAEKICLRVMRDEGNTTAQRVSLGLKELTATRALKSLERQGLASSTLKFPFSGGAPWRCWYLTHEGCAVVDAMGGE